MSIEVHCGACGARFAAPERSAGKSGKCPKCRAKTTVPDPEGRPEEVLDLLPLPEDDDAETGEELLVLDAEEVLPT